MDCVGLEGVIGGRVLCKVGRDVNKKKTKTQLAKMSIDQKFVELTADVLEIYIYIYIFI